VGESFSRRLTAFDIQPGGSLTNRRVFAETGDAVPDGICLDAEGAIWIASPSTQEAVRIREGGEVTDRVSTASDGCFACMLGGDDGRTLFLLTAPSSDPDDVRRQMAGAIRTVRVAVPHAGWP
jgi:sugar lactone lactonase YvrE